jgi:hypothetical protein
MATEVKSPASEGKIETVIGTIHSFRCPSNCLQVPLLMYYSRRSSFDQLLICFVQVRFEGDKLPLILDALEVVGTSPPPFQLTFL